MKNFISLVDLAVGVVIPSREEILLTEIRDLLRGRSDNQIKNQS